MANCRFFEFACVALLAGTSSARDVLAQHGPPRVVVARAEEREVVQTVSLVGTVGPLRRSVLGAEVAGLVREMPVRQGDGVETGQVLCALSDETLGFELAEARARLEMFRSRYEELKSGTREEEKRRFEAELGEAQADLNRWEFEKQRVDQLYEASRAGTKEYRDTYSAYHAAVERLARGQANYDQAMAGPRKETIAQARHTVAAQQAAVDRISADVERTRIRAPFAGHVVRLHTEVGEWIDRGGDVLELIEMNRVLVRVDVPEFAIPYCRSGEEVPVMIDALKKRFTGRIRHIVSQADPSARTFPVEIELDNSSGELRAGMFARATLVSGPKALGVLVPRDAIVQRQGVDYVALVVAGQEGPTAVPTPVTLGTEDADWVTITSRNVPPGSRVVVRGNEGIVFPMPVVIADSEPASEVRTGNADSSAQETSATRGSAGS